MGVLCLSLFWYALLCALSSFATILKRKRELVALLLIVLRISCYCKCSVAFPHDILGWSKELIIVVYPDHTQQLLGLATKMQICSNKVKTLLNIL